MLFTLEELDLLSLLPTENVFVTAQTECFGDQHDELVFMVEDQAHELAGLNQKIKKTIHQLNDQCKKDNRYGIFIISAKVNGFLLFLIWG